MVRLTIDGREFQAEEGKTVLEVANENGIYIPTLCYHEEVSPRGSCRICTVEVVRKERKKLVVSCVCRVAEGLVVKTESPGVSDIRRTAIDLLLAKCPDSEVIQEMAHALGVDEPSFRLEEDNRKCILCDLCARVCKEVVGVSAISLVKQGGDRQIATPFYDLSDVCIGCGSCSYVCPTRAIGFEDVGDTRVITLPHATMEFKLKKCSKCGNYWAPEKQLEYIARKAGLAPGAFDVCPNCRD